MKRAIFAVAVSALLGVATSGCAATAGGASDEFTWGLTQDGPELRLAFGEAHTDNVGLILQCTRGSNRVALLADAPEAKDNKGSVRLAAGGVSRTYTGSAEVDDMGHSPAVVRAEAAAADPVLTAFRKTGSLRLVHDRGASELKAATGGEREAVRRFFSACAA